MIANFCFVCDKELQLVDPGFKEDSAQCNDALMFSSSGNYGSTVYDPIGGRTELLINICDACIVLKKDRVLVATIERPLPIVSYAPWNPEEDYQ